MVCTHPREMTDPSPPPSSLEVELKRAYNAAIDVGVTHFWNRGPIPGVHADEVFTLYKQAWDAYQRGTPTDRLLSERWARAVKHLALALWHEAKIDYLEPRTTDLPEPSIGGTQTSPGWPSMSQETALALLDSAAEKIPEEDSSDPRFNIARRLLAQGKKHLERVEPNPPQSELLNQVRIQAAHEYGRTIEYLLLAMESEAEPEKANGPAISRQAAA